jgi:hypothetical protein
VIRLFLKMGRKVDEGANFIFVQIIEQEPAIYDKRHADNARWDNIGLAWERISHRMESDMCVYICMYYNQNL